MIKIARTKPGGKCLKNLGRSYPFLVKILSRRNNENSNLKKEFLKSSDRSEGKIFEKAV